MMQTVADAGLQTLIFALLLGLAFLFSLRRRRGQLGFPVEVTNELKGLAILAVIFGHLGYFLFTDHNFLYPLSTISGVGVDIFFLLSGYGLAMSALKKNYSASEFYKRRLGKIFLPLWLVLAALLLLDALLLRQFYDWPAVVRSLLGIFPSADIYMDINSPLWYLTPLLFYYLIFPLVFRPRWAFWSALLMGVLAYILLQLPLPVTAGVRNLYELHYLAFPLGVALAAGLSVFGSSGHKLLLRLGSKKVLTVIRYIFLSAMLVIFYYSATAGGKGLSAQIMSILSAIALLLIFICIKLRSSLLELLGKYSYEIYLLHWPLLYHYDFIYRWLPAGLGTALYIIIFLGLAYLLKKIIAYSRLGGSPRAAG